MTTRLPHLRRRTARAQRGIAEPKSYAGEQITNSPPVGGELDSTRHPEEAYAGARHERRSHCVVASDAANQFRHEVTAPRGPIAGRGPTTPSSRATVRTCSTTHVSLRAYVEPTLRMREPASGKGVRKLAKPAGHPPGLPGSSRAATSAKWSQRDSAFGPSLLLT